MTRQPRESGREEPIERLIVTIDGPAGTGKSSVARALAARLGLEFLDTGAMYRAAAAIALDGGIPIDDERAISDAVRDAHLRFDWKTDPPTLLAHAGSIMHRLRDDDVSATVSPISAIASLRDVMVGMQRRIGREHPRLVSEGRDQGSVVFPDACVKIYLDASPRVRAQRRAAQLGGGADIDRIERELRERDDADMSRPVGPLVRPQGAHVVDTSDLSFKEVIDELERIVRDNAELPSAAQAGRSASSR